MKRGRDIQGNKNLKDPDVDISNPEQPVGEPGAVYTERCGRLDWEEHKVTSRRTKSALASVTQ